MYLTNFHFYNLKNYLYSKPVKGLQGYGVGYRFAFNGKEKDNETYGEGNAYDFGARIYDSRLGRWMSSDPKTRWYPSYSTYSFGANSPMTIVDEGGEFLGTIIGAAVGAAIGGTIAAIKGDNVWRAIGKGAVAGAVAGAIVDLTVATAGTGTLAVISAGSLSGAAGDAVHQGLDLVDGTRENFSMVEVGVSAILGGGLGYIGSKLSGPITRAVARLFRKPTVGISSLFTETEMSVVNETEAILNSESFRSLRGAMQEGVSKEITIGGRTIILEPQAPISGMTLFEENAFVLGKEAFKSEEELTKTVLHELYRLKTSSGGAGKAAQEVTKETNSAFKFAEKAFTSFFKSNKSQKKVGATVGGTVSSTTDDSKN